MKIQLAAAVALAATLAGHNAFAKTLEDILREKGVITEEDYRSVTKSRPLDYKLGKGFTFTAPDEKFQLSLGARLQSRYTFTDNETGQDASEFRVRRMKLFLSGYAYTKDLTYKLQVNFADSSRTFEDAWLNYRLRDEAQVLFGQEKVQFARQEITSSGALQFVDRANATDTFKVGRDTGLMLHGKVAKGLLNYNMGVYGGVGQNTLRSTNNNALGARVAFNPLGEMPYSEADLEHSEKPLVSIGANYFMDTLRKTSATTFETNNLTFAGSNGWLGRGLSSFGATEKVDIDTFGFDAAFKWRGFSAQGEYFAGQADGQTSNNTLRAHGFYAQAGYFVIPKQLEVATRYSYVDPNRDSANDLRTETSGAVSYYFNKHNLKLQADATNIHRQPARSDDMQYRVQAQIIF
ncbi:porin [Geobacter sp. DSM 9736]|uniref:porin n=1 Tax=Geobacter sp. DSM 9736 TaxID=1277350 RepID=UPI000B502877|nr:porin [Geobacter sp. DSM 9736]SNB45532.1 Phosphate-selective porin [Geobacter sp. DSM 9736]